MPLNLSKVTNLIIVHNVSEIFFMILGAISTISDSSIHQWTTFPGLMTFHLFSILIFNYRIRIYCKNIPKLRSTLLFLILASLVNIGVGVWYNVFVMRKENFSIQVICLHETTIFVGFLIFMVSINIVRKVIYNKQAVDYYNNPEKNTQFAEVGVLELADKRRTTK
jgi:hypothetical protein